MDAKPASAANTRPDESSAVRPSRWGAWLAGYIVVLALTTVGSYAYRGQAITTLSSPESLKEWQEWQAAADKESVQGPVRRDAPQSAEPPALVLLRDYFPPILAAILFFVSLLYGTLILAVRSFRA